MAEKNNPAVSVIIPMYNAEKYIDECLTSLVNQTFKDFEIIIVDDCSTDNSYAVAESFAEIFGGRLKIAKLSANSGFPGIPRNFALTAARGKYVYFLDSDDILIETALEELYDVAEKFNADIVHVEKFFSFGEDKINVVHGMHAGEFVSEPTLETFDIGERVKGFTQRKFTWWACNKLFRSQFLFDNKIKFPETSTFEDFAFAFMCLVAAKNYVRVPFVSYCYRIRNDSLSHAGRDVADSTITLIRIVSTLDNFMSGRKIFKSNPQYKYDVLDFFLQEQLKAAANMIFILKDTSPGEAFNFFRDKVFSVNPQENVSLTSYLFVTASILKLYSSQQAAEIAALKKRLTSKMEVSS